MADRDPKGRVQNESLQNEDLLDEQKVAMVAKQKEKEVEEVLNQENSEGFSLVINGNLVYFKDQEDYNDFVQNHD